MTETKEQQLFFMRWAIRLGEKGRLSAPPNPWVGCVLVKDGEIIGEGYHVSPGQPHAEVAALEQAGALAKGCTAYVSLEPCPHHGRTPPCAQALLEAGIKKVVVPFADPDPNASGKGLKMLQEAGVEVVTGVALEEAHQSLLPYLHHRRTGSPYCVLKSAMSLDGRTAAADGTSQWITSEEARRDVHLLRAQSQAILTGSETARLDRPRLTARIGEVKQPLRVLIDSEGKVPPEGPLFDPSLAPTLVFTTSHSWQKEGIEVIRLPKVTLDAVLEELGKRNVLQLLVEGGAALHTAFVEQKLAQRFCLYVGDCLLGSTGKPLLDLSIESMEEAPRWQLHDVSRFGSSVRLDYHL